MEIGKKKSKLSAWYKNLFQNQCPCHANSIISSGTSFLSGRNQNAKAVIAKTPVFIAHGNAKNNFAIRNVNVNPATTTMLSAADRTSAGNISLGTIQTSGHHDLALVEKLGLEDTTNGGQLDERYHPV
ncbi:hypothetical protein HPP92_012923 [Vanilla planifolia]|uniref:Uncharacterized protein n=1 Tax=Vanilla planifolia TaxID=51239 RepID=A0A835QYE8_VANPL|nr:hypothetical protein HPP92_012923 [Vanilla planifolia]